MSATSSKKIVILGAGPTGLGTAVRLQQLGHENWILLEKSNEAGGLARSVVDKNGFVWDMGGHVIFSHYRYFDELLEASIPEWLDHHRESWVWCLDRFVPYPFQNNIHRLPNDKMLESLEGIIKAKENVALQASKPKNFQEWINKNFGDGVANVFLNPYNYKVWAYRPEQMSVQWMGERVPTVDVKRIVRNITQNQDDVGWGPNATFRFPLHGGTGGIWKTVAANLPQNKMKYNSLVNKINVDSRQIVLTNGEVIEYDYIISTTPLDLLLEMIEGQNKLVPELKTRKNSFLYSSSHIVGLGLKGEPPAHLKGKCWMYFPEDDCPFYRATLFSHYSPKNVPKEGTWSLMFEFSESPAKPAPADDPIEATIKGALNTKVNNK
jgi:protoporphyrinogen oxidase